MSKKSIAFVLILFLIMTTVWGLLVKSLISNETIEQAIDRLIQAHNDDETAHLDVGQSLQSHKASVIIDHEARSIVLDKFLEYQRWDLPFESIDNYSKSIAAGGQITSMIQALRVQASTATNSLVRFWVGEVYNISPDIEKNPVIQFSAKFNELGSADFYITWASWDPWDTNVYPTFGFKIKYNQTTKIYAFYRTSSSNEVEVEMSGIDPIDVHFYRAEVLDAGDTLNFYVDGVLRHSVGSLGLTGTSDYLFSIATKTRNSNEPCYGFFWNFSVQQDL